MKNYKEKKKNIYDHSLSKIFIWSGFDVFVSMLIVCAVVGLILALYHRLDSDGIKLMIFCFAMTVLFSYGLPLLSLFKVWRQERILGIYWKDRTDCDRPAQERDWYLAYNRGSFLLYHRAYIQHILNTQVLEQTPDWGREKIYCIRFEDIRGKKHTLKFSSSNERRRFRKWYEQCKTTTNGLLR